MNLDDTKLEISIEPSSDPSHEKTPVGGASSVLQAESRGLNEMIPEDLDSLKKQVCEYAREDKWTEAERIFKKYGEMVRTPLTDHLQTALHVAVRANSINFVKGLVNLLTPQELEIEDKWGAMSFYIAATSGYSDIVQIMIERNQNLPFIKTKFFNNWLPVLKAADYGQHKMVQYLTSKTLLQKMDSKDIEQLFFLTIEHDMFDVARNIFEEYPNVLAIAKYEKETALEMLLRKPSKELRSKEGNNNNGGASSGDGDGLRLLQDVWFQLIRKLEWKGTLELIGTSSFVSAIADALESGNVQAVKSLLSDNLGKHLPINSNEENILHYAKANILHYAVRQRHSSIVSCIFQMPQHKKILLEVDKNGNNVLHYAAYPLKIEENSSSLRAATKMKNEVAWFKEMEEKFPDKLRTMINKEGKTPKDVFVDKHNNLSREVKARAKGIADSGMLVAALVAAVAFAAALTVPGDKTNPSFTIFILANAAALFTSSASILSFLSNFTTSRFDDSEFVIALHPSLVLGPILLLISIVTMVISFAAASFLIFEDTSKWAAYVVASMGVFPILLYLLFQLSIFDPFLWSRF